MEEHRHRRGSGSFLSQLTNSMGNLAPGKRSASTSAERKESDRYIPTLARAKSLSNIRRPPVPSGLTDSTSNTPTESPNKKQKKMSSITKKHRGRAHSTMTTSDNASTSKLKQSRSCDHDLKSRSMVVYNLEFTFADPQSEESPKPVRIIVDYSLETIASSEELTKDFMNFLEKKFASENFRFYLECNLYKGLKEESERKRKAQEMVREFVKNGSEYEVNIEDCLRENILSSYKQGTPGLFDFAMAQVAGMMKEKIVEFQRSAERTI